MSCLNWDRNGESAKTVKGKDRTGGAVALKRHKAFGQSWVCFSGNSDIIKCLHSMPLWPLCVSTPMLVLPSPWLKTAKTAISCPAMRLDDQRCQHPCSGFFVLCSKLHYYIIGMCRIGTGYLHVWDLFVCCICFCLPNISKHTHCIVFSVLCIYIYSIHWHMHGFWHMF